ncbi:hypothetical protein NL676_012026 [Syzygium grande]|nr:hypothetical protein NL676_012026 [Syzygium grande]
MPPKAAKSKEGLAESPIVGRFSSHLKIGIVRLRLPPSSSVFIAFFDVVLIGDSRDVRADAINALGKHCPHLTDVGFLDCLKVDELALGSVASLRFLSVAGTASVEWGVVSDVWHKLPNLVGLDVS